MYLPIQLGLFQSLNAFKLGLNSINLHSFPKRTAG